MAIRGQGGALTFSREWPEPLVLDVGRIETAGGITRLAIDEPGFWAGDHVTLTAAAGIPFDIAGTGYANCPDGHAFWGGDGSQGPATRHRIGDVGVFWEISDGADFWESEETVGLVTAATFYIHRDQMDRATFFQNELAGHNGIAIGRIAMLPEAFTPLVLAMACDATGYNVALLAAAGALPQTIPGGEAPLSDLQALPAVISTAGLEADQRGWRRQADLGKWVFETDPRLLDPTAIGEEFGDAAKGLIRGSGSFQAILSNRYLGPDVANASAFLRLMLLTRNGEKSRARFLLTDGDDAGYCNGSGVAIIAGALYYETDILLGRCDLDNAADGIVTFSGQFISVGEINLVSGSDGDP
jgi:hypothetical protein